jgi:hypothetical protein
MAKARLWPITICRSDGLYSEPSNLERLKQPDGSIEYFEKCPDDDPSNLLWRRKLGGMLGEAMGGPEHRGEIRFTYEAPAASNTSQAKSSYWQNFPRTTFYGCTGNK